jgi:hypothetical protein
MPFNNSLHPTTASVTLCAGAQATPATLAAETIVIWKEALPENRAILFGQRCVSKTVQLILGLPLMGIPAQIGHLFRFNSATDSDPIRPPIPIHFGHRFQSNSATLCG